MNDAQRSVMKIFAEEKSVESGCIDRYPKGFTANQQASFEKTLKYLVDHGLVSKIAGGKFKTVKELAWVADKMANRAR